jgi:hypothetical protein
VKHAVWADHAGKLLEPDCAHGGLFDATTRHNGMFVPAFSSGNITVGVFANRAPSQDERSGRACENPDGKAARCREHQDISAFDALGGRVSFSVGRYIRDSTTGRMLVVSHTVPSEGHHTGNTTLSYMHAKSTTRSERINIKCNSALFARGKYLDSIQFCVTVQESRFCPRCGASPGGVCACKFRMYKPAHPFDFSGDVAAMSRYPGEYLGTSNAVAAIQSRSTQTSWSSSPSCGKRYLSASRLVSNTRVTGFCAEDSRHVQLSAMFQAFAIQLSMSDVGAPLTDLPLLQVMSGVPCITDVIGSSARQCSAFAPACEGTPSAVRNISDALEDSAVPDLSLPKESPEANTRSDNSVNLAPVQQVPSSLAEHGLLSSSSPSRGCGLGATEEINDLIAREAARRLKNREAASKSNARRKERNEALKKELVDVLRKASELRRVETKLRSENMALRRRLEPVHLKQRAGLI